MQTSNPTGKNLSLLFLFLIISFEGYSQTRDYLQYQDSLNKFTIRMVDSNSTALFIQSLEKLDSNRFDSNFYLCFRDIAFNSFRLFQFSNDSNHIRKAIINYSKIVHLTKDYWNLAYCHFLMKECELGHQYLQLYKNITEPKSWQVGEIKRMISDCP